MNSSIAENNEEKDKASMFFLIFSLLSFETKIVSSYNA